MNGKRGFALVAALWALVVVGALAAAYLAGSRHAVRVSQNRNDELRARQAALGGLEHAHNVLERLHVLSLDEGMRLDIESQIRLRAVWNNLGPAFEQAASGRLGDGEFSVEIRDLGATLNVNLTSESELRQLLLALGFDYRLADVAAQSTADWIDADDLHRARGAEHGYYRGLSIPYEPRNGPIAELSELTRVRGFDRTMLERVRRYLSVESDGKLNLNAAPEPVLRAVEGLGPEALSVILDARRRGLLFSNLFELSSRLSPQGRAELQGRTSELLQRLVFEPRQIEVVSRGRVDGSGITVVYRALYVRSGARFAMVKRTRLEL